MPLGARGEKRPADVTDGAVMTATITAGDDGERE
jgi:hypothetical protein